MAFIVDIRRQAAMQHLMFKAIFELAQDRADFISLLFAKPRPAAGLDAHERSRTSGRPTSRRARRLRRWPRRPTTHRVIERLTVTHGSRSTPDESAAARMRCSTRSSSSGRAISTRGSRAVGGGGNNCTLRRSDRWSARRDRPAAELPVDRRALPVGQGRFTSAI